MTISGGLVPDVSVVISTYNRVRMLDEALTCALEQEGVDHEVIVVDNGSTDTTPSFLARRTHPRLRVIRNERSLGPTGGRNSGLAEVESPWVAFLDDDDLWAPDKLRRQLEAADRTGAGWVYTGCVYVDADRRILGGTPPPEPDDVVRALPASYVIPAGISGLVFRRDRLDGDGLLDDRLRWQTDWDLSLRLLRSGPPAVVRAPLVAYRQHGGQVSQGARRYEPELAIMEEKFADLRGHDQDFDRGVQHRFIGSEALRGGQRRAALAAYLAGARAGDLGSLVRALAVLMPRRLHPWLRRVLLSDRDWLEAAEAWLSRLPPPPRRVLFVQRTLRRYRVPFFDALRPALARRGIDLDLVHANRSLGGPRRDAGEVPWAVHVEATVIPAGKRRLVWLPIWSHVRDADLVVIEQASRLLLNVVLAARRIVGRPPPFALWGHGANLDGASASWTGERVKRWVTRRADWWFAYTRGTAEIVRGLGFPDERITVFQNATDTAALAAAARELDERDVARVRDGLGGVGPNACLFLGNFSSEKRLDLLVAAGDLVRAELPDFELLLVGSGEHEPRLRRLADERPWLRLVGQRFGRELAEIAAVSRLLLVPGWAGLSVVDSFALGLPIVISGDVPHPPEVEYVEDGVNGIVSRDGGRPDGYARTVVALLRDPDRIAELRDGARKSSDSYTLEAMVARVADGIEAALAEVGPGRRRARGRGAG